MVTDLDPDFMPGVAIGPPPASLFAQATAIVDAALASLPADAHGAAVGILTRTGWNTAVVQRIGDKATVVLWIGKPESWTSGLTGGAAVRASW